MCCLSLSRPGIVSPLRLPTGLFLVHLTFYLYFNPPCWLSFAHDKKVHAALSDSTISAIIMLSFTHLLSVAPSTAAFKIQVTGNNIEVTPAMREYVEKKVGKVLSKLPLHDAVNKVDAHLSVVLLAQAAKHSHTAEVTLFMKGGQVLRASEETDYMYASIDLVSHRITRLLRKFKDRKLGKRKEVNFEEDGEAEMEALSEAMAGAAGEGGFQDPAKGVDMKVVKKKQFDMPAMSVSAGEGEEGEKGGGRSGGPSSFWLVAHCYY